MLAILELAMLAPIRPTTYGNMSWEKRCEAATLLFCKAPNFAYRSDFSAKIMYL
jgi:hypothetical protein